MSYEGYTEYLCKTGHLWTVDCYNDQKSCPTCDQWYVWSHVVDQTNGMVCLEDGTIDPSTMHYPLEVDHYEERVIKVPIYKVPPWVP